MADTHRLCNLLDFECNAMDSVLDNNEHRGALLQRLVQLGQLDVHDLHDHLYPANFSRILDSRQMGERLNFSNN